MSTAKSQIEPNKILDAGHGNTGAFFSLVRIDGKLFVHVNVSQGYLVFRALTESDKRNKMVNNFIADVYEQGRQQSPNQLSPEDEKAIWLRDENPDDPDNPCEVCGKRMPLNPLTAIFGCHYECNEKGKKRDDSN